MAHETKDKYDIRSHKKYNSLSFECTPIRCSIHLYPGSFWIAYKIDTTYDILLLSKFPFFMSASLVTLPSNTIILRNPKMSVDFALKTIKLFYPYFFYFLTYYFQSTFTYLKIYNNYIFKNIYLIIFLLS